jgi:hypothetical protein
VGNGFAVAHAEVRCRSHDDIALWREEIIAFPFHGTFTFLHVGNGEAAVAHPTR